MNRKTAAEVSEENIGFEDAARVNLFAVVTVREVAHWYYKAPQTVREAIYRGRLIARQEDSGFWLIDLTSVRALWGDPPEQHEALINTSKRKGAKSLWEQLPMFPELG